MELSFKIVNVYYFCKNKNRKTLHLAYLIGFWKCLCSVFITNTKKYETENIFIRTCFTRWLLVTLFLLTPKLDPKIFISFFLCCFWASTYKIRKVTFAPTFPVNQFFIPVWSGWISLIKQIVLKRPSRMWSPHIKIIETTTCFVIIFTNSS